MSGHDTQGADDTSTPTQDDQASLILGTAGHIDHGKSSLVQALTGTDPDRLAEEKRRGITITLGFAQLVLPSGRRMGVVDVPGHEKFVRHMVAGATGVDVALLVIAADDGIMPQTIEHVAVLQLLGVRTCVVALTKTDLVDEEWTALVTDEIESHLAGTAFANAPVIGVSSRTGDGLDELRSALDEAASRAVRTKKDGPARMPIDRVFTLQGIGTVVTGTLWCGTLSEGDDLVVLPGHLATRARSIQIHGEPREHAQAGNRVAVCVHSLGTDDVRPGDFLVAPEADVLSDRFDAEFTYLDPFSSGSSLKSGARVHVAHGTREVLGRILLMDGKESVAPGENLLVQIRLEEPLPVAYKDQFIVRSYSPMHVIGGGTVLASHPRRRTNLKPEERTMLAALDKGDADAAVSAHLELAQLPETADDIAQACGFDAERIAQTLSDMVGESRVVALDSSPAYYVRPALLQRILSGMEHALLEHHSSNPSSTGISKEALRQAVAPRADQACFDAVVDQAARRGAIVVSDGEISHPKAGAGAREKENAAADALMSALQDAADAPGEIDDIARSLDIDGALAGKAVTRLAREGCIVRVGANRYYDAAVIERYRAAVAAHIEANGASTAADLKEAMGTTRKYAMPLLEYFDSIGFTRREGDLRTLV